MRLSCRGHIPQVASTGSQQAEHRLKPTAASRRSLSRCHKGHRSKECHPDQHSPAGSKIERRDAQAKRLTQEDFAMNHPAGRIGKRLILRVRDVMLTGSSLPLIGPDVFIMEVRPSCSTILCCMVQGCLPSCAYFCSGRRTAHEYYACLHEHCTAVLSILPGAPASLHTSSNKVVLMSLLSLRKLSHCRRAGNTYAGSGRAVREGLGVPAGGGR